MVDSIDPVGMTVASATKVRMQSTPTSTTSRERRVSHTVSWRSGLAGFAFGDAAPAAGRVLLRLEFGCFHPFQSRLRMAISGS